MAMPPVAPPAVAPTAVAAPLVTIVAPIAIAAVVGTRAVVGARRIRVVVLDGPRRMVDDRRIVRLKICEAGQSESERESDIRVRARYGGEDEPSGNGTHCKQSLQHPT